MTRPYAPGASRRTAVFAAIIGFHVGVLLLVAADVLPSFVPPRKPDLPKVTILPPKPEPKVAVRPDRPEPLDYAGERVEEPGIVIPVVAEQSSPDVAIDQGPAGSGVVERPAVDDVVAPRLRMRGERLAALVKSCYPPASRRLGEEGRALVRLLVGSDGSVRSWSLVRGTGFARLDAALDCILARLVIEPGRQDGRAVEAEAMLPIVFRLD